MNSKKNTEGVVQDSIFKKRLAQAIGSQSPYPWAIGIGIGKSTFSGLWRDGATPQTKTLLKIAQHTNISLNWLLTGRGPERIDGTKQTAGLEREVEYLPYTYLPHTDALKGEQPGQAADGMTKGQSRAGTPVEEMGEVYRAPWEEYCLVPRYGVQVGSGQLLRSEQVVDSLSFKVSWVEQSMGLDPRELALVNVVGDSMEPTLKEGDLLLLDRRGFSHTDPGPAIHSDAIYVLLRGEELVAKRLQFGFDGSVSIQSDNAVYATTTLSADRAHTLQMMGRVVWIGRRV